MSNTAYHENTENKNSLNSEETKSISSIEDDQNHTVNRREFLNSALGASIVVGAVAAGILPEQVLAQSATAERLESSGDYASEPLVEVQTLKLDPLSARMALGTTLQTFFGRVTPDPKPGKNTLRISNLPAGTRAISVWMTEFVLPNNPHAGAAIFSTTSVQLSADGTECFVRYNLDWRTNLPAAAQIIYGPA